MQFLYIATNQMIIGENSICYIFIYGKYVWRHSLVFN